MNRQDLLNTLNELLENAQNLESSLGSLSCEICDNLQEVQTDVGSASRYITDVVAEIEEAIEDCENVTFQFSTTYKKATCHISQMVLCNHVHELYTLDNWQGDVDNISEVFQWFITDCNDDDVQFLVENYERMFFAWCEELQLWILAVDHYGTPWDYVSIGTNNEYDKED